MSPVEGYRFAPTNVITNNYIHSENEFGEPAMIMPEKTPENLSPILATDKVSEKFFGDATIIVPV